MIILKQQFIKKQLIHFLKQNNAYEIYMFYFNKREENRNKVYTKSQYFSKSEPANFIDRAFTWCNTKEGWVYWHKLNKQWVFYTLHEKCTL